MRKKLIVGSRESALAVAQSRIFIDALRRTAPQVEVELVTMKSTGDLILDQSLEAIGGKGLFTRELEQALLDGRIDLAVHSLKDMPVKMDDRLPILALSAAEDPRDVLVYPKGMPQPGEGSAGCSSARRRMQLGALMPGRAVTPVRGNVMTRLDKLDAGQYGLLVLAAAGLHRLGRQDRMSRLLSVEEMVPAAGQGILAVQGRAGEAADCLGAFHDPESACRWRAERAFTSMLGGSCTLPIGAFARVAGTELRMDVYYADEASGFSVRRTAVGEAAAPERLGERLAHEVRREAEAWGRRHA